MNGNKLMLTGKNSIWGFYFNSYKKLPLEKIANYLYFVGLTSNYSISAFLTNGFAKLNQY